MIGRRLSVCYAAPGQNLVPWAGPTRNVLSVAEALSQWADVTVAFRRIPRTVDERKYGVMAIERGPRVESTSDDNAVRGLHPLEHLSYCRKLRLFAKQHAERFDIVLEKGWRLSGWLAVAFQQAGVPAVLVENDVRFWTERTDSVRQLAKYALHGLSHGLSGVCSRRLPRVIAETDDLKRALVARRGLKPERVDVVELGVDHSAFRPMEQGPARQALGIRPDAYVMLYVGAMDEYHDLSPVIDGLAASKAAVELHVVGGGEYRERFETQARQAGISSRFYGPVPYADVPSHIAAADVCIAPYRRGSFRDRVLTFSTLKIPEYLACARPVVSVPGNRIRTLIGDGVAGFIVENDAAAWHAFLKTPPSRNRLAAMRAHAARAVESVTWSATAGKYLDICESVISPERDSGATAVADAASLVR
jgi:glycosyltransferase involved in cell wall biosynthesis